MPGFSVAPESRADIVIGVMSHCRPEAPPAPIATERGSSFEALTPRPRAPDGCACVAVACARRPRSVRALAVVVTNSRDEVSSTPTVPAIAGARSSRRPRRRSRRRSSPRRSGAIEAGTCYEHAGASKVRESRRTTSQAITSLNSPAAS